MHWISQQPMWNLYSDKIGRFFEIILSSVRICTANPFHAKSIFRFLFSSSFIFDLFAFPQALKQTKKHPHSHNTHQMQHDRKKKLHIVFNLFLVLSVVKCFENSQIVRCNKSIWCWIISIWNTHCQQQPIPASEWTEIFLKANNLKLTLSCQ